jgi:hypothetical protein
MLTLGTTFLAGGEEATERYSTPKGKTARRPQHDKGARDVMTYAATWLRQVSLLSAGGAALEVRGAGGNELALPLSPLH